MQKTLQIGTTQWIYIQEPNQEDSIKKLAQEYEFHEMMTNDLLGVNAHSKIEKNDKHFFLALTFTKYQPEKGRYLLNELDVIIGDNYIITTTGLESTSFSDMFEKFSKEAEKMKGSYKASPYYILYRIIDSFYDKTMKSLAYSSQKLLEIQNDIAEKKIEDDIVNDLIKEDFNKITIRHNFLSQKNIIDDLIDHVRENHEKHLNVYFNNLKVKLSKIINTINILTEKNDSLMSAYNTLIGIKNNNSVTRLTFVNAIFMPLTLIAGIGGMSERSGMTGGAANYRISYPLFIILCLALAGITYYLLRRYFLKK